MSTTNNNMNDMYTILINEDHSFIHTNKKRIMYRSNMIDTLRFLVNTTYDGLDMTQATATLEYVLPISREYNMTVLTKSDELFGGKVEYTLPVTIDLTSEVGDIEMSFTFTYLEPTDDGGFIERTRKTDTTTLHIHKTNQWADYIANSKLDNIARIMLTLQAKIEEEKALAEMIAYEKANNIKLDKETQEIYLVSDKQPIGDKISLEELGHELVDATDEGMVKVVT